MSAKIEAKPKPPPPRTGACGATSCTCAAYDFVGIIAGWQTCWCGHSQAVHARAEQ